MQGGCESPVVAENCGNVIASALCPSKCPASGGRRLQEAEAPGTFAGVKLQGKFRRLMADFRLNKIGQKLENPGAKTGRRLGFELPIEGVFDKTYEEIYYTFNPAPIVPEDFADLTNCTPGLPNLTMLMSEKMYAVQKWNDAFEAHIGLS